MFLSCVCFDICSINMDATYTDSLYNVAINADKSNNISLAIKCFKEYISKVGDINDKNRKNLMNSYYMLGKYYLKSNYSHHNVDSAHFFLIKAASLNSPSAARLLSIDYLDKDRRESFYWLEKSAELGDIKSNYELGELYLFGNILQTNDTTITSGYDSNLHVRYVTTGLTQGNNMISYSFIKKDTEKAYKYFSVVYDRPTEKFNLRFGALEFLKVCIDHNDYEKAFDFIRYNLPEVNSDGCNISSEKLAEMYWYMNVMLRYGLGTQENVVKADYYLEKSAELGNDKAKYAVEKGLTNRF